jgi:hypothetical protein
MDESLGCRELEGEWCLPIIKLELDREWFDLRTHSGAEPTGPASAYSKVCSAPQNQACGGGSR